MTTRTRRSATGQSTSGKRQYWISRPAYKFKDVNVAWWESQSDVTPNHRELVKLLIQNAKK